MSTHSSGADLREQQLDEIIAEYLRRKHAGEAPAEASLLAEHAEFADELRDFLENEARVARIMQPLAERRSLDPLAAISDAPRHPVEIPSTVTLGATTPTIDGTRYRLHDFHARGGMGEIWVGHDQRIGRDVAVKFLRRERPDQQERFQIEAQITGQLEHPGIVRLYDLDVDHDGQPFYVMQFIRGRTLKDAIDEYFSSKRTQEPGGRTTNSVPSVSELAFHGLLEVMLDLCQTVAYAHSRGVLHRDLKPDNVMLGAFGETLVLDWGLAKVKDQPEDAGAADYVRASGSGSSATQAGAVLGSPPYISPEAASGRVQEVDEASDIFLLGATMYEILTGRPPRQGSSHHEMVELARTADPPAPRSINKSVPRPLEAICLKAMARRKQYRYVSALEMATDLRRFLAGEPVSAYQESPLERLARWARRHRRTIGYAAVALLMLGVALFGVAQWRDVARLQAYDRGAAEVEDFRGLASEVHYQIAATDPLSENVPYYQMGAGARVARQALAVSDRWGNDLSRLSLDSDQVQEGRKKDELRHEIYDLTLLLVQTRLQESSSEQAATESLALLDRAWQLGVKRGQDFFSAKPPTIGEHSIRKRVLTPFRGPTSSYFRLRAECHARLDQVQESDVARERELDPRTPKRALDYFLQGEIHRHATWNHARNLSEDERRANFQKQLEVAVQQFGLAIDENPRHYWAHLQLGRCLMALEKYPEAVLAFDTCLALRPAEPWAHASLSLAYALQGDSQKALGVLDRLIDQSPKFQPALYLNRAFVHLLRRDDDRALADLNRILNLDLEADKDQRPSGAAYYRSGIRERRGDGAGAMADLAWVIDTDPQFARAYLNRARLLFALGQDAAALYDLNKYLSLTTADFDEGSWIACYERGRLLVDIQEALPPSQPNRRNVLETLARQQFQEAIRLGGNVADLFQELGRLHFLANDPTAALSVYEQGLATCPQSAALHLSRGWLFAEENETAAAQEFEATLQLEPHNHEALAALGYVHAKTRSNALAERYAMEATLLASQNYSALFNIACVHAELGQSEPENKDRHHRDAITLLRRAITLWKDDGSPAARSIPGLIEREKVRAFRSLKFDPEFERLLE